MSLHVRHSFPCCDTNDNGNAAIEVHIDVKLTSSKRHSAEVLSTTAGNSIAAMVAYLWRHFTYVCHVPLENCKMLPKIYTVEKCAFLKLVSHSQIIQLAVLNGYLRETHTSGCYTIDTCIQGHINCLCFGRP